MSRDRREEVRAPLENSWRVRFTILPSSWTSGALAEGLLFSSLSDSLDVVDAEPAGDISSFAVPVCACGEGTGAKYASRVPFPSPVVPCCGLSDMQGISGLTVSGGPLRMTISASSELCSQSAEATGSLGVEVNGELFVLRVDRVFFREAGRRGSLSVYQADWVHSVDVLIGAYRNCYKRSFSPYRTHRLSRAYRNTFYACQRRSRMAA